jgi:hypothetical protein
LTEHGGADSDAVNVAKQPICPQSRVPESLLTAVQELLLLLLLQIIINTSSP